ncbi:MAG: cytochrome-c peroxidase [Chitinophagales bacterium]|nr:cytochrome-c peroxidase [Chitinophagales bacterium]
MIKQVFFFSSLIFLVSCSHKTPDSLKVDGSEYDLALQPYLASFEALPTSAKNEANVSTPEKIALGHALYYDSRLSMTGKNSCNSCHNLKTFGVDNLPTSPGDNGGFGGRNSPTTLNAAFHTMQFWDGRAADVEEQAGGPILNPVEMAIPSKEYLMNRLSNIEEYKELFAKAYPNQTDPYTYLNVQHAIASFERELLTPSRFDDYLNGNKSALTKQEKQGMMQFALTGCTTCHNGVGLGGNSFQVFGVYDQYWKHTNSKGIDKGLADLTDEEMDMYKFKVPSLRNVAETAPYFHDGSVKDLREAVKIMGQIQLAEPLTDEQIDNITAFLKATSGKVPEQYQSAPKVVAQHSL